MTRVRLLLGLAMLAGCGHHDRLEQEGDPCRTLMEVCADDEHLLVCIDDVWTARNCDDICGEKAPGVSSNGCEFVNGFEGYCVCEPPPDGCTPGEAACPDEQSLEFCDAATWTWMTIDCGALCAANPINSVSLGCQLDETTEVAACSCTAIGTGCTSEAPVCIDDVTLASCESGTWTVVDCAATCPDTGACLPGIGAACTCG